MARLPTPGGDSGNWGTILNTFLSQVHASDGTLKTDSVTSDAIAPNAVTTAAIAPAAITVETLAPNTIDDTVIADGSITNALIADGTIEETKLATAVQTKLNEVAPVTSVASKTGDVSLTKTDVGLDQVDNTSDATKNAATATLTNKTLTSPTITTPKIDTLRDTSGSSILAFTANASASNYMRLYNATTGNAPQISAVSSVDTDIHLNLVPKGAGTVQANGVEVATISGTQTLTNKTLANPVTGMIYSDNVSSPGKGFEIRAGGVNYVAVNGTAAGNPVYLSAKGDDTNISLYIQAKGDAPVYLKNDKVNYLYATGTDTGVAPTLTATGSDTNVNLNLRTRNAGTVQANGVDVVTTTGTQTLTNKTLTNPVINGQWANNIRDSNGNIAIDLTPTTSAVNYIWARNGVAGDSVQVRAQGSDTSIHMDIASKGVGSVRLMNGTSASIASFTSPGTLATDLKNYFIFAAAATGGTPTMNVTGADTDVSLNLATKGAGTVKVNGADVVTTTGTQTLTNKTLTTPNIDSIKDTNGNTALLFTATASAVNYARIINGTTGQPVQFLADGADTDISIYLRPRGTNGYIHTTNASGQTSARFVGVASIANYWSFAAAATGSAVTASAVGTDTNVSLNLISKGSGSVQANGVDVVTATAVQTLTNKTLTSPKVNQINDTNGNAALEVTPISNMANYFKFTGSAATGSTGYVAMLGVGSDPNVTLQLVPKAGGRTELWAATGLSSRLAANGPDTDINLNLISKGTGTVQANGVDVVTTSGTQTLTNKTLTSPTISSPTIDAGAGHALIGVTGSLSGINLSLQSKADGGVNLRSDYGLIASFSSVATPVNSWNIANSITGGPLVCTALGSDTDIGITFNPKGAGNVMVGGVPVVTTSGTQTLTNKTLTSPKIDTSLLDTNGNALVSFTPTASAVVYLNIKNQSGGGAGSGPFLSPVGPNASHAIYIQAKGNNNTTSYIVLGNAGYHSFKVMNTVTAGGNLLAVLPANSGGTPALTSAYSYSPDANVGLDLQTKGTGAVMANGVPVATQPTTPPATATSAGVAGQIAYDSNYFYQCIATNTWVRAAMSTW